VDPGISTNTGIAIVNPNTANATITLVLRDSQGVVIAVRSFILGGQQQISRFVTQLFFGTAELAVPFSGLVFISSDAPIGVLGLAFIGPSFTSLPVATQLGSNSVGVVNTGTTVGGLNTPTPPTINPLLPPPVPLFPITGIAPPLVNSTGLVPNTTPTSATGGGGTIGVVNSTPVTPGIGLVGIGALLLPQVASGGGWVTRIVIANTSTVD